MTIFFAIGPEFAYTSESVRYWAGKAIEVEKGKAWVS
jgi:hypothetical protein